MEQRILYFDIVNGISGDMTLATLLNLGIPKEIFLEELSKLNLNDEFEIKIVSKIESGIKGTSGDMTLATLLNLGIPKEIFLEELSKLNLNDEFEIKIVSKIESGIKGTNVDVIIKEENARRHLVDIFSIIDNSRLNENVKSMAKRIFMVIGEAEAKVHGTTIDKIHFHEVGAIDSIVDIVGASILIDLLCVDKIYASTVPVGSGFVKCDHGFL